MKVKKSDVILSSFQETKKRCQFGCEVVYFSSLDKLGKYLDGYKPSTGRYSNKSLVDVKEGDCVICYTKNEVLSFGYVVKALKTDDLPDIAHEDDNGYVVSKIDIKTILDTVNTMLLKSELKDKIREEVRVSQNKAFIKALAEQNPDLQKLVTQWESTIGEPMDISIKDLIAE